MIIHCVWEHNGNDTLLYATNFVGAYTRGESLEIAKAKMPQEIVSYCSWLGMEAEGKAEIVIVGEFPVSDSFPYCVNSRVSVYSIVCNG